MGGFAVTVTDWIRVVNAVLATIIVGGLVLDKNSPWRDGGDPGNLPAIFDRFTSGAIAGTFGWLAFGSLEAMRAPVQPIRVAGLTFWLVLTLIALVVHSIRMRKLQRKVDQGTLVDLVAMEDDDT